MITHPTPLPHSSTPDGSSHVPANLTIFMGVVQIDEIASAAMRIADEACGDGLRRLQQRFQHSRG